MNSIKKYRKKMGYKLNELAKIVGISVGYMCHLERGTRKNPSYAIMKKIAVALNKSIEQVFDE